MKAIINLLKGFINGITSVVDFVISMIEDIVYIVKLTGEFVLSIPDYFSWLPGSVLAIIITIFSIVVIYKVLGREG